MFAFDETLSSTLKVIRPLDNWPSAPNATLRSLIHYVEPLSHLSRSVDVLDHFVANPELHSIVLIDQEQTPIGIIDRGKISEIFLRSFSRDLLHKQQISEIMDTNPIIVDIDTSIDDIARIIIDSTMRHMINGIILLEHGIYAGIVTGQALFEEVTYRRQRDLYMLANYDHLTGLPNRVLFNDRLEQTVSNAQRTQKIVGLFFVDIDHFKHINDTLGHAFGDRLLVMVAERLFQSVRRSDTVARLGGDEFVIILNNLNNDADAERIAATIITKLREPMLVFERSLQITVSMGGVFYPQHDETIKGLLLKADMAMYEVKQQGRNAHLIYSAAMDQSKVKRIQIETLLRMALESGELSLAYQPQIQLDNKQLIGVEVLLRWQHPQLGNISPSTFIPIAEDTGLIIPIGKWVLKQACLQQLNWIQQQLPALRVAVNISAIQFNQPGFCDMVREIIAETQIDPQYLELELTESAVMNHAEQAIKTLQQLRGLGVKLAIDDFGTGYSSLSYLRNFSIDRIKIDQSFVRDINMISANEAIVRAIIALANSLGLELIAEGVENDVELQCLSDYGVLEAQGYFFGKPMADTDFLNWLTDHLASN